MVSYGYKNTLTENKQGISKRYVLQVSDINYYETSKDGNYNQGRSDLFNSWQADNKDSTFNLTRAGYLIRGNRMDFKESPIVAAQFPSRESGETLRINVGDFVIVEEYYKDYLPIVVGILFSKNSTWDNSLKTNERPISPVLELPGSSGKHYTYNPLYLTFLNGYTATDTFFGVWYDRFVKFNSSDTYKNFKSLNSYNSWVSDVLKNPKRDEVTTENILRIVEDPFDNNKMEHSFYLGQNNFPYRPDSVFDVTSSDHQSKKTDAVLKSTSGVSILDTYNLQNTDKYPKSLPTQTLNQLNYTSYDEIINQTLSDLRKSSQVGEFLNADLPLDPKEVREIRIGRSKLLISDLQGDGKELFITLKSASDQGISFIYKENDQDWSQVRIRGSMGESILLESYGKPNNATSRISMKGVSGQIFEMYEDTNTDNNYIYLLSTDTVTGKNDYSTLTGASYFLATNKSTPTLSRLGIQHGLTNKKTILTGSYDSLGYSFMQLASDDITIDTNKNISFGSSSNQINLASSGTIVNPSPGIARIGDRVKIILNPVDLTALALLIKPYILSSTPITGIFSSTTTPTTPALDTSVITSGSTKVFSG